MYIEELQDAATFIFINKIRIHAIAIAFKDTSYA